MVLRHAGQQAEFGDVLLTEGIQCLPKGEVEVGKNALKRCIYTKMGFERLAEQTGRPGGEPDLYVQPRRQS